MAPDTLFVSILISSFIFLSFNENKLRPFLRCASYWLSLGQYPKVTPFLVSTEGQKPSPHQTKGSCYNKWHKVCVGPNLFSCEEILQTTRQRQRGYIV